MSGPLWRSQARTTSTDNSSWVFPDLAPATGVFRILTVCTGNVARSPVIERLLQSGLDTASPGNFEVRSAGTRASDGRAMADESREILLANGANPSGFRSRRLTERTLHGIDLVIVAAHEHTASVIDLRPGLLQKTFVLREFERLVDASDASVRTGTPELDRAFIRHASTLRSSLHRTSPQQDDLADPYGRGEAAFQVMASQVLPAMQRVVQRLAVA